jgi:hypothetical protein
MIILTIVLSLVMGGVCTGHMKKIHTKLNLQKNVPTIMTNYENIETKILNLYEEDCLNETKIILIIVLF